MRRLTVSLFFILPFFVSGQVSMEEFLAASLEEPELRTFIQQDNYLTSKPFRLAPIQKLEFRTESNQLDPQRQDYALRLNPANPWEIKRNNEYFKSYQQLLQLDRDRLLKESLQERYNVIIWWMYYQELILLKDESKRSVDKHLKVLEAQRFSGYFDAEKYVELKLDKVETSIELEATRFDIDNQRSRIEALYAQAKLKSLDWPHTAAISVERLEVLIDSLVTVESAGGEVAYREKQIDVAKREWQLEKSNIGVGFLQTQYQKYRIEQGRKPWSISMGVTIPVFNPNKGDMAKRKLEVIEAEGDLEKAKTEQQTGRDLTYRRIKSLIARYRDISSMTQELNVGELSQTLQQMNNNNPAATIRLEGNLIKLKAMAARLKQEIYLSYIEYLGYCEALQQLPLINYLSPSLNKLVTK